MGFLCCSLLEAMDPLSEELADILPCTVAKEVGKEREEGGLDMGDMIELQTMVCEDMTITETEKDLCISDPIQVELTVDHGLMLV